MKKETKDTLKEIIRFLLVGGFSTIIDYAVFGLVLWLFDTQSYTSIIELFTATASSPFVAVLATALGFIAGLVVNYFLSIFFVFIYKDNAKNIRSFIKFAMLSFVGFLINTFGMYLGFGLLGINKWIVKILLTILVMVYNYVSKRILIFSTNEE